MSSEQEQFVLKLFDSFWFNNSVLNKASRISSSPTVAVAKDEEEAVAAPRLSSFSGRAPSMIIGRSISDQALSSKDDHQSDSDSSNTPKSVLGMQRRRRPPALETIVSGKEVGEFVRVKTTTSNNSRKRGRIRRNGSSRSLSELEYEELKGFMDLGFVFSDEDKDSSLVSIIPGLQRLGRKESNSEVPRRPYLSEAWDVQDLNNKQPPLMVNWRIPAFGNEMELKHHLKFWAHTVASTVR